MYTGQSVTSLGFVPADDKSIIEQAARETNFRVWVESVDYRFIEVFTKMPYGTDHGPFWNKCKELQEATIR